MRKRYLVSAVYLVALHVLAVALVAKVEAVPKIVTKVSMARVLGDVGDRMKARRFSHPVIFIGDSHTQTIGALPNALNFGATGSTTTGAQIVVKRNAKKLAEASAVMLMIGTNDVWRHKLAGLDDAGHPARRDPDLVGDPARQRRAHRAGRHCSRQRHDPETVREQPALHLCGHVGLAGR